MQFLVWDLSLARSLGAGRLGIRSAIRCLSSHTYGPRLCHAQKFFQIYSSARTESSSCPEIHFVMDASECVRVRRDKFSGKKSSWWSEHNVFDAKQKFSEFSRHVTPCVSVLNGGNARQTESKCNLGMYNGKQEAPRRTFHEDVAWKMTFFFAQLSRSMCDVRARGCVLVWMCR